MNQHEQNLEEVLALADSAEEQERLRRTWQAMGRALEPGGEDLQSPKMPPRLESALKQQTWVVMPTSSRWLRAAVFFGLGALTGALAVFIAGGGRSDVVASGKRSLSRMATVAALPSRSAAERLSAVHVLGSMAQSEPAARQVLIERILHDPTPGVQLAAIDHLGATATTTAERERLAQALSGLRAPVVQLALLDLLSYEANPTILRSVESLSQSDSADPLIQQHAGRAVAAYRERKTT